MGEVRPRVTEAIGIRVDQAAIFGVSRPASWRADIITSARQAGNNVAPGSDLYNALLGENGVISKVEQGGRMVNGAGCCHGYAGKTERN